jgi:two-component system OmpR family sensor kinase
MFTKRSIRKNFLIQLIISSASLILTFSTLLYFFIERSIHDDKYGELIVYAKNITNSKSIFHLDEQYSENFFSLNIEIIYLKNCNKTIFKIL